ncbi:hypothetical protein M3Y97_00100700 [Aphelenchoides bicaudatus]|nr:hypothetical protein M3Y97_00100700 [Aphelenchoides bicaudatus]
MSILSKQQISKLYKNRDEITLEDAESYFCAASILSSIGEKGDSLKLCTYLLLEKLGAEKAWSLVKKVVIAGRVKQKVYENIGTIFRKAFKDALRIESAEGLVTRSDIAEQIYCPLMEHCILVKREHAEKFCWILQKATFDRDESMAQMLFNVSTPIVWRYLKSVNSHIRLGAYFVQVNVFPPSSNDSIQVTDFMNDHCKAFLQALSDKSVDICVQAINDVNEAISSYYDQIPEVYTEKFFNKLAVLAKDENVEIRAAVFHGLRFFYGCAKAVLKFEILLKNICPEAIDDPVDRVRCNVFRLLNMICNSRIKVILPPKTETKERPILGLSEVLCRLDYEENEVVEREIALLIYNSFFYKNMASEERYKILNNMCRINRSACLDLHRLLYTTNEKDTDGVMAHMSSVLNVSLRMLQGVILKQADLNNKRLAKYDFESYVLCGDKTILDENNETNMTDSIEKLLDRINNMISCMVVCFASIRYATDFNQSTAQAVTITRYFSEIVTEIISNFETKTDLVDTALSIILLIRNAGMQASKLKNDCVRMLRAGQLNKRYLEIYGLVDMSELMEFLKKGLHKLENEFFVVDDVPARKKAKRLAEQYMHYIAGFIEQFERICNSFVANLQDGRPVDMKLFFNCWKIWTVVSIMKHNEAAYKATDEKEDKKAEKNSRRRSAKIKLEIETDDILDPMLKEYLWMKQNISECPELSANSDFVEHFYNMISLQVKSYTHLKSAIQTVISYAKRLYKMQDTYPRTRSINQSYQTFLKDGYHALEYAEADPICNLGIFEEEADD